MRPKGMQYLTTLLGTGVSKAPGLHESATATGNTGSRAQAASEFARLERERVRLEEKLSAQAVLVAQTEARLEGICRRLEILRRELDEIPAEAAVRAPRAVREAANNGLPRAKGELEEGSNSLETYQIVSLEY